EKAIESLQVAKIIVLPDLNSQITADIGQELSAGETGVEYQSSAIFPGIKLCQQSPQYGRLAGSDLTGQGNETGVTVNAIEKVGKRLLVGTAQEDKIRIGGDGERLFVEAEEFAVHD